MPTSAKARSAGLLDAHEGPGLTDVLAGRASFGQAVQEVTVHGTENGNGDGAGRHVGVATAGRRPCRPTASLAMVPAGAHTGNLAAELASGGMRQTLGTASALYDRVIIDSSPLLAAADVLPLLSRSRRRPPGHPPRGQHHGTRQSACWPSSSALPNINIVGVVVNGIPSRIYRTRAYGYYYG